MRTLDHDAARADEAAVLDDHGRGLHGFEHAADAHAAREVDVFADLGAGTHRGPCVDHRAGVDIGADVHVRRHQDGSRGDVGAVARHGLGHDPHAQLPVAVLEFHLVVPLQFAGLHLAHGLDREVEDHGLLDPLVDLPFAFGRVDGFRRAEFALVHQFDDLSYGLLHGGVLKQCAVFPRLLDYRFEFVVHSLLFSIGKITENLWNNLEKREK